MKPPATSPRSYSEIGFTRLAWLGVFISVFSFFYYYRHGDVLLYGDAVAHINIARRVFDSRTPGLLQLGTVWLPLPHLLILPFIVSNKLWQTGMGGSIPSMAGFVFGVLGIFRLVRTVLSRGVETEIEASYGAWMATLIYAANPNLIYMQSTAMGESLYLAFFIWTVGYFAEFLRGNAKSLIKCGWCLAGACLTRYDGWFLAGVLIVAVIVVHALGFPERASLEKPASLGKNDKALKNKSAFSVALVARFILIAAAAPILWLGYNAAVYRNPLEFMNGPYSARAIEQKTVTVNPAKGNLVAAGSYFLKAAELNIAESSWPGRLWLALAILGSVAAWRGGGRVLLLLWSPLPFYALSVAYGSVPIFVPPWWPFSQYNVRYGLQLLPAFAVFVPLGILFLIQCAKRISQFEPMVSRWANSIMAVAILLVVGLSYAVIWRVDPICYREADRNARGRVALDRQIGDWLRFLPAKSPILMHLGEHAGALEQLGIPLSRTINEGNHRVWMQPSDPDGLWERALADPAAYVDYAIGFEGDSVWNAARSKHLTALVEIHTTGQPPAAIFQIRPQTPAQSSGR
jgi:hypothetical protein